MLTFQQNLLKQNSKFEHHSCHQLSPVFKQCNRVIKLRLIIDKLTIIFTSANAPQTGLADDQKDRFYKALLQTTSMKMTETSLLWLATLDMLSSIHMDSIVCIGGHGFGTKIEERIRLLSSVMQMILWSSTLTLESSQPFNYLSVWWEYKSCCLPS